MTDQGIKRLIRRAQKGDNRAFEQLIAYKKDSIIYIASSVLKNKHDVEDAVQDAVAVLYQQIGDLRSPEAFHVWMSKTVFHVCLKAKKQSKRQSQSIEVDDDMAIEQDREVLPQEHREAKERSEYLHEKIRELPDDYKRCLYFFYFEEMTYAQIAEVMGSDEKKITNQMYRGRKRLRELIDKDIASGISVPAVIAAPGGLGELMGSVEGVEGIVVGEQMISPSDISDAFVRDVKETVTKEGETALNRALENLPAGKGLLAKIPLSAKILVPLATILLVLGGFSLGFGSQGEHKITALMPVAFSGVEPAGETPVADTSPDEVPDTEELEPSHNEEEAGFPQSNTSTNREIIRVAPEAYEIDNNASFEVLTQDDLDDPNKDYGADPSKPTNKVTTNVKTPGYEYERTAVVQTGDQATPITMLLLLSVIAAVFIGISIRKVSARDKKNRE